MRYKYTGAEKINIIKNIKKRRDGRIVKDMHQYRQGDIIELDSLDGWDANKFILVDKEGQPIPKEIKSIKKEPKKEDFNWLLKIKGIGKKTVDDIEKIYNNKTELKEALEKRDVPLRDDVVEKLNAYFRIERNAAEPKKEGGE